MHINSGKHQQDYTVSQSEGQQSHYCENLRFHVICGNVANKLVEALKGWKDVMSF